MSGVVMMLAATIVLIPCSRTIRADQEPTCRMTVCRDRGMLRVEVAGVVSAERGTIVHVALCFEGTQLATAAAVVRDRQFSVCLSARATAVGIYRLRIRAGLSSSQLATFVGDPEEWIATRRRRMQLVKELALVVSAAASTASKPRGWYEAEDRLRRELTPAPPGSEPLVRLVAASERLRSCDDSGRHQAATEALVRVAEAELSVGLGDAGALRVLLERLIGLELDSTKPWASALELEAALLAREVRGREPARALARAIQTAARHASHSDARGFEEARAEATRARARVEELARERVTSLLAALERVALPTDARTAASLRRETQAARSDPYLLAVTPEVAVDLGVFEECLLFRKPCRAELLAQVESGWRSGIERLRSVGMSR